MNSKSFTFKRKSDGLQTQGAKHVKNEANHVKNEANHSIINSQGGISSSSFSVSQTTGSTQRKVRHFQQKYNFMKERERNLPKTYLKVQVLDKHSVKDENYRVYGKILGIEHPIDDDEYPEEGAIVEMILTSECEVSNDELEIFCFIYWTRKEVWHGVGCV
jgi:hypothetical protein